jgi:rare lipoprotein A
MFKMRAKMITVGLLGTAAALLPIDFAKAEQVGHASWYALYSRTASGEPMNPNELTAAHRSLPFGTRVVVENLNNGRTVVVRINDRGPFIGGRIIDLSKAAAASIGMIDSGTAKVRVTTTGGGALAALGEAQLKAKKGVALAAAESAATETPAKVEIPAAEMSAKMKATVAPTPAKAKTAVARTHVKTKSVASRTTAKSKRIAMNASSKTKHLARSYGSQSKVKMASAAKSSHAAKSLTKSAAKSGNSYVRVAASSKGSRAAARHGSRTRIVVASAAHPYTLLGKAPGFMKPAYMRSAG